MCSDVVLFQHCMELPWNEPWDFTTVLPLSHNFSLKITLVLRKDDKGILEDEMI